MIYFIGKYLIGNFSVAVNWQLQTAVCGVNVCLGLVLSSSGLEYFQKTKSSDIEKPSFFDASRGTFKTFL